MEHPSVSVILPFYRQSAHMQEVLDEFARALREAGIAFELVAVMNGLADLPEPRQIQTVGEGVGRVVEVRLREAGWGRAVLAGMAAATGDFVCYTNTARTPANELVRLVRYALISDQAVVKATRVKRSTWARTWTSIFYNIENRLVLKTPIWDVNATPKIIPRRILAEIPLTETGDLIDAELTYRCFRKGIPIIEIPAHHIERRSGKSTTSAMSAVKMFLGLFRVRRSVR
ncbi:MAG: hypothetical protein RL141_646 [Candidatus Parcubacteria bacterium]|jgi:uncharacterized protein YjeT (DUF2065 family)